MPPHIKVVLANDVVPNPEDVVVYFTQSLRGRPAIMANGVRFLIMSENKKKILWRCSSMATKKIKCPARITMLKETPPKFIINKADHIHAELKRNKYGSNKHCYNTVATEIKTESIEIDGDVNFEIMDAATGQPIEEHQLEHEQQQQDNDGQQHSEHEQD